MEVFSKKRFLIEREVFFKKIVEGMVFIYPTDTIYGIGCDATNDESVRRIRKIKRRDSNPFSVAVPSKGWVRENCVLGSEAEKWLQKLPGPYTLLLRLKNKSVVAESLNPDTDVLGVRILGNWFSKMVESLNFPIVSTSANVTERRHMKSMEDVDPEVASSVDFIVYDGPKEGRPSSLVKLTGEKSEVISR